MTSVMDFVKKHIVVVFLALVVGVAGGLPLGWATVNVVNTTPAVLRPDLQEDYLRMAIDSFRVNRDPNLAVRRWDDLGPAAAPIFVEVQKDPGGLDPVVILAYGEVIQVVKGAKPANPAPETVPPSTSTRSVLMIGAVVALVLFGAVLLIFFLRRMAARGSSEEIQPGLRATHGNRDTAKNKTSFDSTGVAPAITQNMTTYVAGDDLYDESFSIDTTSGDFLGEYGVGVSETIGIGEPKKVTALEIWLFDKNDIKTATKVLLSAHAFGDPGIRGRLEAKGELILVEPQREIVLETETLQLLATVVELQYGDGAMPEKSYFERVTVELAIWRKADQP